jgi:hypothetical protein
VTSIRVASAPSSGDLLIRGPIEEFIKMKIGGDAAESVPGAAPTVLVR